MKKVLTLILSVSAASLAMGQNTSISKLAPYDNTLNGALTKPFKTDSVWHTAPQIASAENHFKMNDIDYKKMKLDEQFKTQMLLSSPPQGFKMPNMMLQGNSKMPVVRLEGLSKMPVMGGGPKPKNNRDSVVVIP